MPKIRFNMKDDRLFCSVILFLLLTVAALAQPSPSELEQFYEGLKYCSVGPSRGGRVTAVAGHRKQPSTFYMGATGGGVWKTTDYGQNWTPISDAFFDTGSIGSICIAPSNPDILYVGTGSDGLRSNVIIGKGIYKSTDAGKSWKHLGLENTGNIGSVIIHPENPDIVYAAAIGNPFKPNPERGVYRSHDGGATWQRVLFVSEQTGAVDLEFAPFNPAEIYAATWQVERKPWTIISGGYEGGLFKSNDGGDNWERLEEGLPSGLRGKADLAVSPADPDRVYVLIEAPEDEGGVYRSDDRGKSWDQVTDFQPIRNRPFYYTNLYAHPGNADILWGMAEGYYKSEDAGKTWKRYSTPHGDNHDLWVNPDHPEIMIQSNDGGANVSLDGGMTWSTQYNQPTAELYQVDVSDEFPYRLYAGQQDNSTISIPSLPPRPVPGGHTALWESHGGCETGPAVPKPGDPDIVYANCKGRFGVYNRRTGQEMQYYVGFWNLYGRNPKDLAYRFQRVSPIHVSPHDPNRIYHTSQFVHVTMNEGRNWETISPDLTAFTAETQVISGEPITIDVTGEEHFSTLYEIQESPHEPGVIWAGSNDGPIHITRDGGKNWKDVTPDLGPYGRVQTIEVSPHNPARAYACILRYQLGDFAPYVFKTENYGETWDQITGGTNGIPSDYPVRVVREDPDRAGLLYAGTEFGMFLSFDDGLNWHRFQLNLPVTPVTDIKIIGKDLVLSTMGRGFWILYNLNPIKEFSQELAGADVHLFKIRDTYRLYLPRVRSGASGTPDYPDAGVNIDYYLSATPDGEVKLEIFDSKDGLIRSYSSEIGEPSEIVTSITEPALGGQGRSTSPLLLPKSPGFHRFVWNLRHPGPWGEEPTHSRGPMAAPGNYKARLTIGSKILTQEFNLNMDPRVVAEGTTASDVKAQVELALQVRETLSEARRVAVDVVRMLKTADGDAEQSLTRIKNSLITNSVRYSPPETVDQLKYLLSALMQADQHPSRDAYERHQELRRQVDEARRRFEETR